MSLFERLRASAWTPLAGRAAALSLALVVLACIGRATQPASTTPPSQPADAADASDDPPLRIAPAAPAPDSIGPPSPPTAIALTPFVELPPGAPPGAAIPVRTRASPDDPVFVNDAGA